MKMKEYKAPEMEVFEVKMKGDVLLIASGSTPGDGGSGDGIDE